MFEKIKSWFRHEEATVEMQPQPIEINPAPDVVLSRNESRLARLLTILDPSEEIKAEIERRQKEL